jgi:hypothetical protein
LIKFIVLKKVFKIANLKSRGKFASFKDVKYICSVYVNHTLLIYIYPGRLVHKSGLAGEVVGPP